MGTVNLDGKLEMYSLKAYFSKAKVKGGKVKLKLVLSDKSTFIMSYDLGKIEDFNKFTALVEDFFYEQPCLFDVEDFLNRECNVCVFEVFFGGCAKRRIDSIEPIKVKIN